MNQPETLYDRFSQKLKNNRLVVFALIAFAVVLGISQFQGALSGLKEALFPSKTFLKTFVSISRYDFLAGTTQTVKSFEPVRRDISDVDGIADAVTKEIVSVIGPKRSAFEINLKLRDHTLRASQSVPIAVIVVTSPMAQVGRVLREIGETDNVDLQPLSSDPHFFDTRKNVLEMEVGALEGGFDRIPLQIFKRGDTFSFSEGEAADRKSLQFVPRSVSVILQNFEAHGDRVQNASISINASLQRALGKYAFLHLSPLTVADLDRKRAELQQLQPGISKSALASQSDVDFIISGSLATD